MLDAFMSDEECDEAYEIAVMSRWHDRMSEIIKSEWEKLL